MLQTLENATPPGDSPDYYATGNAQDCWICADLCMRVLSEPGFDAGAVIEYALEPVVNAATEELKGV